MATLVTLQNYIDQARYLMQDTASPFRYSTEQIVAAFNIAIHEAFRVRPDLFQAYYETDLPTFDYAADLADDVAIDRSYRMSFLYFTVGYCQLADQEDTTDARASQLINKFTSQLLVVQA